MSDSSRLRAHASIDGLEAARCRAVEAWGLCAARWPDGAPDTIKEQLLECATRGNNAARDALNAATDQVLAFLRDYGDA